MSNAYCLPVALEIAPPHWIAAAIIALHAVPLAALAPTLDAAFAGPLVILISLSMWRELRRQRIANPATRLAATADNQWRLSDGIAPGDKIDIIDHLDCHCFMLLLATQHKRQFRLAINCRRQPRDQLHRLRVLLKHKPKRNLY